VDEIPMTLEREAGMAPHVPMVGVGFCLHPIEDDKASADAGRPIFKDVEFVRIIVPGDKNSTVFQPATEAHRNRFPLAYAAFQRQAATPVEGTPLEHWPAITRALAMTYKAANIPTVEALAEVHDGNLKGLGPDARQWREKARAYVAQAADAAAAQKLAVVNQELRDQLADQQRQINDLAARLQASGEEVAAPTASKPPPRPRSGKKAAR
jgi:hypothetical protein